MTQVGLTYVPRTGNPSIAALFRTPERYLRSVHLERDFHDRSVLRQYVATDAMRRPFERVLDGLREGATRRAWRVTGDYGTGKSSFALVLAHLLREGSVEDAELVNALYRRLQLERPTSAPLLPVLVTGRRARVGPTIAEAALRAAEALGGVALGAAEDLRHACEGNLRALTQGLENLAQAAGGVLLVLDELGKFLEHAAARPSEDDVFALQELAELASRSGGHPIVVVGLLHQGLLAYTHALPAEGRQEWEKVAGRFEELTFDQPLPHTMALIGSALQVDAAALPDGTELALQEALAQVTEAGWGAVGSFKEHRATYPLHPMLPAVLVRFFGRFGQHERSLYHFLLSHEVGALQDFAQRSASPWSLYAIADFYDYVRATFGHALGGGSYLSRWARLVDTIDALVDVGDSEARVLRTVAVLNAVDAEHLRATPQVVTAALHAPDVHDIRAVIEGLRARGLLFQRPNGDLRLWPATSVSLEEARREAEAALGAMEPVAAHVARVLPPTLLFARRHAISTGTLRYFEVRYASPETLSTAAAQSSEADGVVLIALCETSAERERGESAARLLNSPHVVTCLSAPLAGLRGALHEVRTWAWVLDHTAELAHDAYAASEAVRLHAEALRDLLQQLAHYLPVHHANPLEAAWWYRGERVAIPAQGITALLSRVCDELYPLAPLLSHELLNRRTLSKAAAAARNRLVERMFLHPHEAELGFNPAKAPPERSMYLSLLSRGQVHLPSADGRYAIAVPSEDADPLRLRPAIKSMQQLLLHDPDARVGVRQVLDAPTQPPYGVRPGLALVLLAILLTAHDHDVAVYEDGTFVPRLDAATFLRLSKAPDTFELQWSAVGGVRAAVFARLAVAFAGSRATNGLLDVVTPLCLFVAQDLPDYARKTRAVDEPAIRVRDVLLSARDPVSLLFRDLPEACGLPAFGSDVDTDPQAIDDFVDALRSAIETLRAAYPTLLRRIETALTDTLRLSNPVPRERLAAAARGVALRATVDLSLKAFALRLADEKLALDPWLEAIGSTVVAKPPRKWLAIDAQRFETELVTLAERFRRLQRLDGVATKESAMAFHVGLTRLDGAMIEEVIDLPPEQAAQLTAALDAYRQGAPGDRALRLVALSKLLWDELDGTKEDTA